MASYGRVWCKLYCDLAAKEWLWCDKNISMAKLHLHGRKLLSPSEVRAEIILIDENVLVATIVGETRMWNDVGSLNTGINNRRLIIDSEF